MASYQYAPLRATRDSTRLLRLLPAPHVASEIRCELFGANINDASRPPYEALSYTWGDPSDTVPMTLSGYNFPITTNLAAALRALRSKHDVRTLWVDAVCINQLDLVEQGAQVAMMWDIYRAADGVVVWLGPEVGDSDIAMVNIRARDCSTKLAARDVPRKMPAGKCSCHAGDFLTHPSRVGVQQLLDSRWFTRVWVLQEVAAAKRVTVACGNQSVDGADFYNELVSQSSGIASMGKVLRKIRPALELMNQSDETLRAGSLPLIELLERFRSWDATKPVDKLFALLSFSSDALRAPQLQPDYKVPTEVLARRIVKFAFLTCSIDETQANAGNEVSFEIQGLFLGDLGGKRSSGHVREWDFSLSEKSEFPLAVVNPTALEMFGKGTDWKIEIANERKLQMRQAVVWLRGASRPTVLSFRGDKLTVVMLATPEPYQTKDTWTKITGPLPSELSKHTLTPNDPIVQWEAMLETMKDDATQDGEHDCKTLTMLKLMHWQEKAAIKAGTSQFTVTLHKAAYDGSYGAVKLLLDANADVNATLLTFGTALHIAVIQGHEQIVQALLKAGADVDIADANGVTPIMIASSRGSTGIGAMLLNAGATLPDGLVKNSRSPDPSRRLVACAIEGKSEELKQLLEVEHVDPNSTTEVAGMTGITALHMAAEMGRTECVAALLAAGADADPRSSTDTTPLHQAAMNGHGEVVQMLLQKGADVNAPDDGGTTPLDFALYKKRMETAEIISASGGVAVKMR